MKPSKLLTLLSAFLLLSGCNSAGPQGEIGPQGPQGEPGLNGKDGDDGVGIVSISKASTVNNVDTYVIIFTDGTTSSFTVTNGTDGQQGIQGVKGEDGTTPTVSINDQNHWVINGVDTGISATGAQGPKGDQGDPGNDGVSIISVVKTSSEGLIDTYTITYSNDTTSTFTVTNGATGSQGIQGVKGEDGTTPTVSINDQNHWVINGVDTGIAATGPQGPQGDQGDPGKDGTKILSGQNDPLNDFGVNGDLYLNTTTNDLFSKDNDTWTKILNIKGATGEAGISVTGTEIDENGDLIVTFSNGQTSNAGHVKDVTKYTVNFYCGDDLVATRSVDPNSKISEPTEEETAGYTIESWHVKGYDERPWVFDGYYADRVTEDVVLEASFVANNYKIFFVDEMFSNTIEPLDVTYNSQFDIAEHLEETGYTFKNWIDSDGEVFPLSGIYRKAENTTLESSWEANTYQVSLDANGGTCDTTNLNVVYNSSYQLPEPTRLNYVFLGWFDNNDVRYSNEATWKTSDNVQLTAKWTNISNTYVFDPGDGQCSIQSMVIGWEDPYELPIPTIDLKEHDWAYGFDCWLLDGEPIPTCGDSWTYSNIGKTLVARYKLRDDTEYLESKYTFELKDDTYAIKKSNDQSIKFSNIPEYYKGKPVTSIMYDAFKDCSSLFSIVIPNTVVSIGEYAFSGCKSLRSVKIPRSVTAMENSVFYRCNSSLIIYCELGVKPKGWKSGWNNAGDLYLTCIWNYLNRNIISQDGIVYASLEENQNELIVISVIDKTKETINIPDEINERKVVSIGEWSFSDCVYLTSVSFSNNLVSIGQYAFSSCKSLSSIIIPGSVVSIKNNAFANCNNSLVIYCEASSRPNEWSATWNLFYKTSESSVKYVYFPTVWDYLNKEIISQDGIIYASSIENSNEFTVVSVADKTIESIEIPNSLNGKKVTSISSSAFLNCNKLFDLNLPNNLVSINADSFYGCDNLRSVILPRSVLSLDDYAFAYSGLKAIYIPSSVTTIGYRAFHKCRSSLCVYCEAQSQPSGWDSSWNNLGTYKSSIVWNSGNLFVDSGILYMQFKDSPNKLAVICLFNESVKNCNIPQEVDGKIVEKINDYAFSGNNNLLSVTIPNSVVSIGEYAFFDCHSLISVSLSSNLISIGACAFSQCYSLPSVVIPDSVTSIDDYAFDFCESLTSISLSNNLVSIGEYAFFQCFSLPSVVIPDSVTSIGEGAFRSCRSLMSVKIPDSVMNMGDSVFNGCNSSLIIYCEASEKPEGWNENWTKCGDIQWGYDVQEN